MCKRVPMNKPPPFKLLGLDHLGIVPRDMAQARWFFYEVLQLPLAYAEELPREQVSLVMLGSQMLAAPALSPNLELLAPLAPESPLSKFLEKKSGGIHHLAFRVDDIRGAIAYLRAHGVGLLSPEPRAGAHGSEVVFVHPQSTGGILVELVAQQHHPA